MSKKQTINYFEKRGEQYLKLARKNHSDSDTMNLFMRKATYNWQIAQRVASMNTTQYQFWAAAHTYRS